MNRAEIYEKRSISWNRWIPTSVSIRVALLVNLLVVCAGAGYLIVDYRNESRQRFSDKSLALREQAMTLHQAISLLDRKSITEQQQVIDAVCERMRDDESPGHHIVVEVDDQVLQATAHHRDSVERLNEFRDALMSRRDEGLLIGKHSENGITVYVGEQMESVKASIRQSAAMRSVAVVVFGFLLTAAINVVIHRLVHRPLRRLVKTIDDIADGKYVPTVGAFPGAELTRLADAVNAMSESLDQAEKRRKVALDRARRVQANLLPDVDFLDRLDIGYFHKAAEDVGGDFLDIFQTKERVTVICLADVVGHGIAPAMITAMLKILVLDAAEVHIDPADIVKMVNDRFSSVCLPEDFATAFLGVWMPESRMLRYISAGHEPALLLSKNEGPLQLNSNGPLIGIDIATRWEPQLLQIRAGDLLVAWTDGITEAWGTGGEQFGKARLFSIVEQHRSAQPRAIADAIERAVIDHVPSPNLSDDCTFVAIRFP